MVFCREGSPPCVRHGYSTLLFFVAQSNNIWKFILKIVFSFCRVGYGFHSIGHYGSHTDLLVYSRFTLHVHMLIIPDDVPQATKYGCFFCCLIQQIGVSWRNLLSPHLGT